MLHARPRAATAALALTALLLAGCADAAGAPTAAPTAAPTPSAAPTTTATPDASAEVVDTTSWLEFATDDGTISFRYPEDWSLESSTEWFSPDAGRADVDDPYGRWMDRATLTAPNGQQLLQMADFVDVGGACDAESWRPLEVLASEDGPSAAAGEAGAQIATVALGTVDDRWTVGVGIADAEWLEADATCRVLFASGSSDGGMSMGTHFELTSAGGDPLWTVDSLDDARAYTQTAEYATILEILRSVELA